MWIRWTLAAIIALGFLVCGYFMVWDWDKALLGVHNFRQTQTAIAAYWMLKDGLTFDYQTPALGKPWVIPFEAPFYQFLAVFLVKVVGLDLDCAGRLVSVAFWIACLWPLTALLRLWVENNIVRWAIVLGIWSCPTYLYWSDAFMIESIALFLSLAYLLALMRAVRGNSIPWLAVALVCGVLGGLQKATTFLIVLVPAVSLVALELFRRRDAGNLVRKLGGFAVAILVPMAAIKLWTAHADSLKALNPMGRDFITSAGLTQWNFGTLAQRVSADVWSRIIGIEAQWGAGRGSLILLSLVLLVIALGLWSGPHRMEIAIFTASSLTGTLVFTNLFFIHEYYNYECSLYLQLAFGLALTDFVQSFPLQRRAQTGICTGLLLAISAWGLLVYDTVWVPMSANIPTSAMFRQACAPLTNAGDPQDILLIYGWDWNPLLPYYSGRKALMDRSGLPLDAPTIKASLDQLGPDEHVAAMVLIGPLASDANFINARVQQLHLDPHPVQLSFGPICYLRQK